MMGWVNPSTRNLNFQPPECSRSLYRPWSGDPDQVTPSRGLPRTLYVAPLLLQSRGEIPDGTSALMPKRETL